MYLFIAFILAVILMVVSISKWKVHPFLAIMGVSLILAIVLGLPLVSIPDIIGKGFSGVFTSIGLVIILGILIGSILEHTGGAMKLADMVVRIVGKKHPEIAMLLLGFIVSIPVFCDSGFVITNPIKKAMSRRTGVSAVTMTVCLSAGLYCAHVFIPPTPGPIAAAGALGVESRLILVVLLGTLVSVPCLAAAWVYARWIGKKVHTEDEAASGGNDAAIDSYEEALSRYGRLPGGWDSAAPILMPVLLMAVGSIAALPSIGGEGGMLPLWLSQLLLFLGKPFIALTVGLLFAIVLLIKKRMADKKSASRMEDVSAGKGAESGKNTFRSITEESLKTAGPILFITAAGAVLGKVIIEAGLIDYVKSFSGTLSSIGIFFPFIIAALLKSAQGSSTVAITTTAGIMGMFSDSASLMGALGLNTPVLAVLTVLAIGAGAMTVSHANDSYFWVVTNFSGLTPSDGYKTQTAVTGIMGFTAIAVIAVAVAFL